MNYKVGDQIKLNQIEVDKYRSYYYAGASGDFNLIHIDNDFAKMVGLDGIILQGLCTMAFVYRAAIGNEDPGKLKKIKVRFQKPVRPLDKLIIKGQIREVQNNFATLELLAENQNGEQVITNAYAVLSI